MVGASGGWPPEGAKVTGPSPQPPGRPPAPEFPGHLRWRDGRPWADPRQDEAFFQGGVGRPPFGPGAAVYNGAIWAVALVPLANVLLELVWKPTLSYRTLVSGSQRIRMLEMDSVFTPVYFAVLLAGLIGYVLCVWSAYRDWKKLKAEGVLRPFHWAWAFLAPAVYVIGRSVVVRRLARPRGLAPVWAVVGTAILAVVVAGIKVAEMLPAGANAIPT